MKAPHGTGLFWAALCVAVLQRRRYGAIIDCDELFQDVFVACSMTSCGCKKP